MAAIVGAEIMVDRFISADPDNGLLATANSDATVSNVITRSLATGDVTLSAPANSTGTNTRRWLLDRPIVTTSTIDVSGAATFSSTVAVAGLITATGGQIAFPATQAASANLNTLDDYQEESFTATLTGLTATVTGTAKVTKVGNTVTLNIPLLEGTSNATTKTITGLPARYWPAATKHLPHGGVSDNGGAYAGARFAVGTDGVLTFYKDFAGTAFTASGATSILPFSISYTIA